MKLRLFIVGLWSIAFLGLSGSAGSAQVTTACTLSTLYGTYGLTVEGSRNVPGKGVLPVTGTAVPTFDGRGHVRQLDTITLGGVLTARNRVSTGTYSVSPNGTGTMTLFAGPVTLHIDFVVTEGGRKMHTIRIDPGTNVLSFGEKQ